MASLAQRFAGDAEAVTAPILAMALGGIAVEIAGARFIEGRWFALAKTALFAGFAAAAPEFGLLAASAAYDFAYRWPVPSAAVPPLLFAFVVPPASWVVLGLSSALAAAAGWVNERHEAGETRHRSAIDRERTARYRLEQAQRRIERMSGELVSATERAERTRIAQEMHDGVGHRLTGALMQLQAVERLVESQPDRARTMLRNGIEALQAAADSVRETVYDLRPRPESGAHAIRRLAAECRVCPVELSLDDEAFAALPESHREACIAAVRELLTNAARHSRASRITIRIEAGRSLRLVYRDDGVGTSVVREGIGLHGIRTRAEALGGTVGVSGHDGFVVRCVIPVREEHERDTSRNC